MSEIVKRQEKQKELLLEEVRKTPIVNAACKRAGIGRATFYRWKKADEEFAIAIEEALDASRQLINDMAESQLIAGIKEQNMTAIIFWLKNNHKTYRNRVEVNANVTNDGKNLSPEQQALILQSLALAGLINKEKQDEQEIIR